MFGVQGRVVAGITLRATIGRKRALLFASDMLNVLKPSTPVHEPIQTVNTDQSVRIKAAWRRTVR